MRPICPDEPATLRRWLPHLDGALATRPGVPSAVWLITPPPDLHLDPLLLPILAVLPSAPSLRLAAERCAISESALVRVLRGRRWGCRRGRWRASARTS